MDSPHLSSEGLDRKQVKTSDAWLRLAKPGARHHQRRHMFPYKGGGAGTIILTSAILSPGETSARMNVRGWYAAKSCLLRPGNHILKRSTTLLGDGLLGTPQDPDQVAIVAKRLRELTS